MVRRIAHVTPVYPPYRGGIGVVAAEYARGLRARGERVTVFTPDYHREQQQEEGVVRLKPWYAWGLAAFVPQLLWKLRGFDVIHVHHSFYGGEEAAALASFIWRIPLVVTYHMQPKAAGWVGMIMRVHRAIVEPLILWQAKKILVSSNEYAIETGVSFETQSQMNKIGEMPFGVDTKRFASGRADDWRAKHGIPSEVKVILFVGGLDAAHYFKGLDVLLAACTELRLDISWRLVVVGSGEKKESFVALARDHGLAERVVFAGSVPFADLPKAYRAADLHVLPSIDRSEAFGLVTLEAMASGIPSVVSDMPGMRTLLIPGETGFLAPAGNAQALAEALEKLLQQDGLRTTMGTAARHRAEGNYDAEKLLDRLLDVYRNLRSSADKSA